MVDVALFELEGVLFDTAELRRTALRDALMAHGIVLPLDDDVVDGLPARGAAAAAPSAARVAYDDVMLDLIALRADRSFSAGVASSGAAVREGALAFFEEATGHARLAIVTRASRTDTQALLRLVGLENLTAVTVCADDVLEAKPAPDGHRMALERLGRQRGTVIAPATVIALEDGPLGIRAAHAAGLRCVAIGPMAPHAAMEADAFVPSLRGQTLKMLDALSAPGREQVQ